MDRVPWTNKQLRSLGQAIRDGHGVAERDPTYDEVVTYFNGLALETQDELDALDWEPLLHRRIPEVTSRPKTIDTLQQKLQRDRNTPLQSVQDIRSNPHSGYRAVHVWLKLPSRVEIQVRTHLQGMWANMYESAADTLGRGIRYGSVPHEPRQRELVAELHQLSIRISDIENERNVLDQRQRELADHVNGDLLAVGQGSTTMLEVVRAQQAVQNRERSLMQVCKTLRTAFESMPRREGST